MEYGLIEALCTLGVGGALAVVVFLMYRRDKNASEERIISICEGHERKLREDRDQMASMVNRDQETRERNTSAITELVILLRKMNGRK